MRLVCSLERRLSQPRILIPDVEWRTMFFENVTSSTTVHGALPAEFRGVNKIAYPFCASAQLFSKTLSSITTRRAFFSSKRFLIVQRVPSYEGWPIFHDSGLNR